ncbi:unnamed protein product [Symbiodinium pilosum]|uniref:Uncharacterized protein n=1 Tax=Symbiodinium pilosum TaxID=2952 RepID=A0A812TEX0_SYMPI|nr:unnamed protein product [Symbiodinium pilosum]
MRVLVLLLLAAVSSAAWTSRDVCELPGKVSGSIKLLQLQRQAQSHGVQASPQAVFGGAGCPCIGLDRISGTSKPPGANSEASYPADIGAHCDVWDNKSCREDSCQKMWCFVNPCNCNMSSHEHPLWQGLAWQGHPVYASAATCNNQSSEGKQPSVCEAVHKEEVMGKPKCKCIGLSGLRGSLYINISRQLSEFPADLGSSCQAWDNERHPDCQGENQPGWCSRQWCYVDPCSCSVEEPPKVSAYFPRATYGNRPLYYSYETCNSPDTFTFDSHSACVNQETEAKCLALGGDPDDPEIRLGVVQRILVATDFLGFPIFCNDNVCPGLEIVGSCQDLAYGTMYAKTASELRAAPTSKVKAVGVKLKRYLYKQDGYYNRIVPDWNLQIKTLEQQYLYEGDFSLLIKELTDEGSIVQDITTGVFGFLPQAHLGSIGADLLPGDVVNGAKCIYLDNTIIQSPDPTVLRLQTGVVFEWDEATGEGYIIPSEEQDAFNMIRVLRRDIRWHDSRRLFPGQFVQFETALPHEVPVKSEEDPQAPLALRVRGLEVRFSLEDAYELIPEGAADPLILEAAKAPYRLPEEAVGAADAEAEAASQDVPKEAAGITAAEALPVHATRDAYPVSPGRPELSAKKKVHPLLQRFAEEEPILAEAESPSWMWQPHLEYLKEERYDPIMPIQLRKMPAKPKRIRILTHEVALERGDMWQEGAQRRGSKLWNRQKPPGRRQQAYLSQKLHLEQARARAEEIRWRKLKLAASEKRARQG